MKRFVLLVLVVPQWGLAEQFSDNFDRPDTVAADQEVAPCPLGAQYSVLSGKWSIADGVLVPEGKMNKSLILTSPEMKAGPFTAAVDFFLDNPESDRGAIGFNLYYQDSRTGCMARLRGNKSVFKFQTGFSNGSSNVKVSPEEGTLEPQTWYRLTVRHLPEVGFEYSVAKREMPDQPLMSGTLKARKLPDHGKFGIAVSGDTRGKFDNLTYQAE